MATETAALSPEAIAAIPEIVAFLRADAENRNKSGATALWTAAAVLETAAGVSSFGGSSAPAPLKIVRVTQTSFGCPSQWDAWTESGDYVFLHYRHGYGHVRKDGETVSDFDHGTGLDGVISLEKFCELARIELAP